MRTTRNDVRTILLLILALTGCGPTRDSATFSLLEATPLLVNTLSGSIAPVHDPSIFLQKEIYYLFSSDPAVPESGKYLAIRCSSDKLTWKACGQVFTNIPAWVSAAVPGVRTLWAPDISFFCGIYHLYYSGSTSGSQTSVIGMATNTTLDAADPAYQWVDRGQVLTSQVGDDFNAIDPNILVDSDQRVWLTYGSYWSGIKQREIDPLTGTLLRLSPVRYDLATRPNTSEDAVEGSSLVHFGDFYYLFLSVDHCCLADTSQDNYKQIVGRSRSPNGPFLDANGSSLMDGGGSILLQGNPAWLAPGGGTAYIDSASGESLLVFHALHMAKGATPTLWVKSITWQDGWPSLN